MHNIFHIDFNSFFATVEQQANPRLRGKPIGVSGGDRLTRTVIGAASVEAKLRGVKTGMRIPEALKLCPDLILVRGDSDKYLSVTKKFLNILKGYSDKLEIFSIDEVFLEVDLWSPSSLVLAGPVSLQPRSTSSLRCGRSAGHPVSLPPAHQPLFNLAFNIKQRIRDEVGEWITVSIGISYNKMLSKLAGSLYKPDGLVAILDQESAVWILDRVELDEVCGIGSRTKLRLNNMGIFNFSDLRKVPLPLLLASFKSYGWVLYNFARGIDESRIVPFFEKEEVKSIGHRHTISHDVWDPEEIKQTLLKLSEMVARRLRAKKLEGRTISIWYRAAFNLASHLSGGSLFEGRGMQTTIPYTNDGLTIFKAGWEVFHKIWDERSSPSGEGKEAIRMIGISVSNLKPVNPATISFLDDVKRREVITKALDKINDRYGEFTLQRGILLTSTKLKRMPNSFLSDRRFKI